MLSKCSVKYNLLFCIFLLNSIGFVFPVYIWGLPNIVKAFTEKIPAAPSKYFFAVATCGLSVGKCFAQIKKILSLKGNKLSSAFKIKMPGNYIPMYNAYSKKKQKKMFSIAKEKVKKIALLIKKKEKVRLPFNILTKYILGTIAYNPGMKRIKKEDKKFLVDEKCDGCSICEKICPVKNIKMKNKKPVWQHKCEQCLACIQWCPQQAIQYGKKTASRERYHHPQIKIKELMVNKKPFI